MKFLKIAVLPVILLSLLVMGGCATTGPETTITGFQKVPSFENKKVALSLPVVVEKDMETNKDPDATEREVANEMYNELKKNLANKGILADRDSAPVKFEFRVHYVSRMFAEWEYFGSRILADRHGGSQILVIRGILKNRVGGAIAQIDSIDNEGMLGGHKKWLTDPMSAELANQIEKILKEGVSVGKSP